MKPPDYFPFELKDQQKQAFSRLTNFVKGQGKAAFVLRGYAGTGKTSLMIGLTRFLARNDIDFYILASTGRAAKILIEKTGEQATTIHRMVYTFQDINDDLEQVALSMERLDMDDKGQLKLVFTPKTRLSDQGTTVYIVDESSMVADRENPVTSHAKFGNGKLLTDLLNFDPNGRFVFIGDPCQLPPIQQPESPALSETYLTSQFQIPCETFDLTEVVRQGSDSGILTAAMRLRELVANPEKGKWPTLTVRDCKDIDVVSQDELYTRYLSAFKTHGENHAIMLCHSNAQRVMLNEKIRQDLGRPKGKPMVGDLLMVTQNNLLIPLVNGDFAILRSIGNREVRAQVPFLHVTVSPAHKLESTYPIMLVESVLEGFESNLTQDQFKDLMIDFYYRMKNEGIKQGTDEFRKALREDPYLNALKAVHGYAVTCHKCQGGEWEEVYLYQNNKVLGIPRPGVYQWWYTALTRARKSLIVGDEWFVK
jgi:ATP-dependent exoDNAse (exonuclease V) alpha subunit